MMLALLLAGRGFAGEMDDDAIKKFEAAEQERKAEFNRLNDLVTVAKKNTKEGKYAEACQIYDELKLRLSKESDKPKRLRRMRKIAVGSGVLIC